MNSNKLSTACLLLLILLTSAHFNTRVLALQTQQIPDLNDIKPSIQQAALKKLSTKVNTPINKLEIVYTFIPTFRTIGKSGYGFVILDRRSGKVFDIAVDANGKEMNIEKLAQQDTQAYASKYGKLSQALFRKLTSAKSNEQIPVVIKLKVTTPSDTDIQQQQIENEQVVNEAINKIAELGFNVNGDNSSPAVYGNLTPMQIREIQKLDIVDSIDIS
jgi:chitinase